MMDCSGAATCGLHGVIHAEWAKSQRKLDRGTPPSDPADEVRAGPAFDGGIE